MRENGCLSSLCWPTPNTPNGGRTVPEQAEWKGTTAYMPDGRKVQVGLEHVAKNWNTPKTVSGDYTRDHGEKGQERLSLQGQAKNWRTPQAGNAKQGAPGAVDPERGFMTLTIQAKNWRTPRAGEGDHGGPNSRDSKGYEHLAMQAANWPTPKAFTGGPNSKRKERGAGGPDLQEKVKNWPTPAARDWRGCNGPEHLERGTGRKHLDQLPNFVEHGRHCLRRGRESSTSGAKSSKSRRVLNPLFACYLMGWPPRWTDCGFLIAPTSFAWWETASSLWLLLWAFSHSSLAQSATAGSTKEELEMKALGRGLDEMMSHAAMGPRAIHGLFSEGKNMAKKKEAGAEVKADAPKNHTEEVVRDLECELSREDIEKRAAQLLQVSNERKSELGRAGSLRQEAATLKSRAKERDSEAREAEQEGEMLLSEIEDLIRAVNDKVEKRPVNCRREYDYQTNKIRLIRLDTEAVVEERDMRNSERQMALGFELEQRGQGKEGYMDKRGRLLFVSDGFTDGKEWGTFYRSEQGSLKRFTGKGLEQRETREKAEADLKKYAMEHGFKHVDENGEVMSTPAAAEESGEEAA